MSETPSIDEPGDHPLDLDERELCSDGACIGVIGDDGRCRVCGRAGGGAPREARPSLGRGRGRGQAEGDGGAGGDDEAGAEEGAHAPHDHDDASDDASSDDSDDASDDHRHLAGEEGAPDDEDRRLCPDGGCLGVIGPDGRCKVCGLAADGGSG